MTLQQAFSAALFDPQPSCPQGVICPEGSEAASRFSVYRNNVQSGLINALGSSFPVVAQWVGETFFHGMAHVFVQKNPPDHPVMSRYGRGFPDFIQGFAPANSLPYLADVARLEWLCVQAYHAADALPLNPHILARAVATPETLEHLRMTLHPSVATLHSAYAVAALWIAHTQDGQLQGLDPRHPQSALVLRHGLNVEVFAVSSGCVAFIRLLKTRCPLGQATDYALQADPEFDLSQCLALLISKGAITDVQSVHEVRP